MSSNVVLDEAKLVQLFSRFRDPKVDEFVALALFGERKEVRGTVWELEPKADLVGIKAITFRFEDTQRGAVLLDKIELALTDPWQTTVHHVSELFAADVEMLPPGPSVSVPPAVFLRCADGQGLLQGDVEFDLVPRSLKGRLEGSTALIVTNVVFRRFYP
jgi:hypothetical protein